MNKKIEIIEISSEEDEEEVERLKKLERESPFYCDRIARCLFFSFNLKENAFLIFWRNPPIAHFSKHLLKNVRKY